MNLETPGLILCITGLCPDAVQNCAVTFVRQTTELLSESQNFVSCHTGVQN